MADVFIPGARNHATSVVCVSTPVEGVELHEDKICNADRGALAFSCFASEFIPGACWHDVTKCNDEFSYCCSAAPQDEGLLCNDTPLPPLIRRAWQTLKRSYAAERNSEALGRCVKDSMSMIFPQCCQGGVAPWQAKCSRPVPTPVVLRHQFSVATSGPPPTVPLNHQLGAGPAALVQDDRPVLRLADLVQPTRKRTVKVTDVVAAEESMGVVDDKKAQIIIASANVSTLHPKDVKSKRKMSKSRITARLEILDKMFFEQNI